MQQVIGGSPAVQTVIYKAKGASLTGLGGLCGNGNGVQMDDCNVMINDVSLVDKKDSLFKAAPYDFAGCTTPDRVQHDWRNMGTVSNADTCAEKCKGFGLDQPYPEFYVKKSPQFRGQVDCWCANLVHSQTTAWARFAMKPKELQELAKSSRTGSCTMEKCVSLHPRLHDGDICVFKEKEAVEAVPCIGRKKQSAESACRKSHPEGGALFDGCVIDACNSDNPAEIEQADAEFEQNADAETEIVSKSWTWTWERWGQRR